MTVGFFEKMGGELGTMDGLKDICDDAFRETLKCQGKESGWTKLFIMGKEKTRQDVS